MFWIRFPKDNFGNSMGTLCTNGISSGTLLELHKWWTNRESFIALNLFFLLKRLSFLLLWMKCDYGALHYGRWAYANRTKCDLWLIPTVLSRFSLAKIKILVGRIHEGYMVLIPCLFYCVGITPMSFTKQKWLLVLENANAFSRNLALTQTETNKIKSRVHGVKSCRDWTLRLLFWI